jgi:hypothetical protein
VNERQFVTSNMQFSVTCSCGRQLPVTAAEAGTAKLCECGRNHAIPRLSELRRSAVPPAKPDWEADLAALEKSGLPAEVLARYGAASALSHLFHRGIVPLGMHCLRCAIRTSHFENCWIECQAPSAERQSWWTTLASLLSIHVLMDLAMDAKPPKVHGEELVVPTSLRLCPECATALRRNKPALRELVLAMSLYRPLFRDYPEAQVGISSK